MVAQWRSATKTCRKTAFFRPVATPVSACPACRIFGALILSMKRIALHLLLWSAYVAVEFTANLPHYRDKSELLRQTVFFLPVIAIPFYFVAYYLVPRLLWQGKKTVFWLSCVIVFLLVMVLRLQWENLYWSIQAQERFRIPLSKISKNLFRDYAVIALGVCLKIIRDWDKKDRLATRLGAEKRDAELQFLRAQIHPHFLFNTLNNLYGLALKQSPQTPDSILKLSGLLDFILYECNAERIPLRKEVELIRHYIELERLRFGERLDLRFDPKLPEHDFFVAPLLLLPFVENAFKHGAANTAADTVFVKIDLFVEGETLFFQVENSNKRRATPGQNNHHGIGLRNVEKRLELLYPGHYSLKKIDGDEVFLIALQLTVLNSG
jgi:sensor histidine kinase YesM